MEQSMFLGKFFCTFNASMQNRQRLLIPLILSRLLTLPRA